MENLERGIGVEELFLGPEASSREWAVKRFGGRDVKLWSAAGQWLVKECVAAGIIDPTECELRGRGVWRDAQGKAIAHCGDVLVDGSGCAHPLGIAEGGLLWLAKPEIERPSQAWADTDDLMSLFQMIQFLWNFEGRHDAEIIAGWAAGAMLGGFPRIRPTLVLSGKRGTGKSELMSILSAFLGPMALPVCNDVTEAGLRQTTNGEARTVLIDEAEGGLEDPRRMSDVLALLRRRYGADGGRTLRGRADHSPISFMSTGSAVLAAISAPPMSAADASRSVRIELGPLPLRANAATASRMLVELTAEAKSLAAPTLRRLLMRSPNWDAIENEFRTLAVELGADHREAATTAAVATGRFFLMNEGSISEEVRVETKSFLETLIARLKSDENASDGDACLQHLLGSVVHVEHGVHLSIAELISDSIRDGDDLNKIKRSALGRVGLRLSNGQSALFVASGPHPQLTRIFLDTRWRQGAHRAALKSLPGATLPKDPIRIGASKIRAVRILMEALTFFEDDG